MRVRPSRSRGSRDVAFELARAGNRLLSVDKANVLTTSRMWREVVTELGATEYPDVELTHGLVDSVAMNLVMHPESFDVLVMENTFGDILSDVAAGATGGLGLAASASLSAEGPGIFEPVRLGAGHRGHGDGEPHRDAALARDGVRLSGSARRRWRARYARRDRFGAEVGALRPMLVARRRRASSANAVVAAMELQSRDERWLPGSHR